MKFEEKIREKIDECCVWLVFSLLAQLGVEFVTEIKAKALNKQVRFSSTNKTRYID